MGNQPPDSLTADGIQDDEEADLARNLALTVRKGRRASVQAERILVAHGWRPPEYPKTPEQVKLLEMAMGKSIVFSGAMRDSTVMAQLIAAFEGPHAYGPGLEVVTEREIVSAGAPALFVVESGRLQAFRRNNRYPPPGELVCTYEQPGQAFGELDLLHVAPRQSTVMSCSECILWSLDRETFISCVIESCRAWRKTYGDLLKSVDVMQLLTQDEQERLLDVVDARTYASGDSIIASGAQGDEFFILDSGTAEASEDGKIIREYKAGEHFGEVALIASAPHTMDIVATSNPTVTLVVSFETFQNVVGDIHQIMIERKKEVRCEADTLVFRQWFSPLSWAPLAGRFFSHSQQWSTVREGCLGSRSG